MPDVLTTVFYFNHAQGDSFIRGKCVLFENGCKNLNSVKYMQSLVVSVQC